MSSPWFEQWFNQHYLTLYQHRDENDAHTQVGLIEKTLELDKSQPILDLACGMGRHVELFHQKGYWVQGIDLSIDLIREGKKHFPHLFLNQGDMRTFTGGYKNIFSLFTSFGYLPSRQEDLAVLLNVFQALKPQGYYWLDFFNRDWITNRLVPEEHIDREEGGYFYIQRQIENGRVIKKILHTFQGQQHTYEESVHFYSQHDLISMFEQAGFEIAHSFGDYKGNQITQSSPRVIVVGKKP